MRPQAILGLILTTKQVLRLDTNRLFAHMGRDGLTLTADIRFMHGNPPKNETDENKKATGGSPVAFCVEVKSVCFSIAKEIKKPQAGVPVA